MPGKEKEINDKIPVLKGLAAEKKVLEYVKEMNRPFGAADIFANLKGLVPKASVQKILVALAEKGDITQKAYGKILVFVAKQAELDELPIETIETLEAEEKKLVDENKAYSTELKTYTQELTQLRNTPTNQQLEALLYEADQTLSRLQQQLQPLRSGQSLVTTEEMTLLDAEWQKWRAQWVERRKKFHALHDIVTDAMLPEEREDMDEDLGIEYDTPEHNALEHGPMCKPSALTRK